MERAQKIIVPVRNLVSPVVSTELAKDLFSLWNIYIYICVCVRVTSYLHIDQINRFFKIGLTFAFIVFDWRNEKIRWKIAGT